MLAQFSKISSTSIEFLGHNISKLDHSLVLGLYSQSRAFKTSIYYQCRSSFLLLIINFYFIYETSVKLLCLLNTFSYTTYNWNCLCPHGLALVMIQITSLIQHLCTCFIFQQDFQIMCFYKQIIYMCDFYFAHFKNVFCFGKKA